MVKILEHRWRVSVGATDVGSIDCTPYLDDGELVASLTVAEQTTSDLTIGNEAVSTAELTILGQTVAIGKAVQFSFSGQLRANTPYSVLVTLTTDSTPARVEPVIQIIDVVQ